MPEINILDKHVAELIAAGEVVERPASVIKELLENAIDAGASSLTAEIRRGGITYMRITDNGCGIDRSNIKKAFISHATSKISKKDDLDSIITLGFRGEALASIAAVSRVEVMTRAENEEIGTRYLIEGSQEVLLDDAGCPKGTTIIVRDIFYNTPARMKFLKKDVTEGNAVAGVVDRIALSHPEVAVRFIRDGKEVLSTSGDGNMRNTVFSVFGREFADSLIPVSYETGGIKTDGFVSKPANSRANRTMQFFFLNGRLIKTRTGTAALEQAYKNAIMVGRFPACVLNITVPPNTVDVNVHPAKTEVRFADEKRIFDAVYYGAKYALEESDTRPRMSFEAKAQMKLDSQRMPQPPKAEQMKISAIQQTAPREEKPESVIPQKSQNFWSTIKLNAPKNEDKSAEESDESLLLNNPAKKEEAPSFAPQKIEIAKENAPEAQVKEESYTVQIPAEQAEPSEPAAEEIEPFRVIGEAFKTYILVEQGDKMLVIDKHAAHERMIFERLKKDVNDMEAQMLLSPVTVTLSAEEYNAVLENRDLLLKAGYNIDDFGQGMVIVTECPTFIEGGELKDIISELAGYLADNKRDMIPEKLDWIYHSTACRAAIKAGDKTTEYEMERFVKELLSHPDIRYCPHGRPVLIEMKKRDIERNFGRV